MQNLQEKYLMKETKLGEKERDKLASSEKKIKRNKDLKILSEENLLKLKEKGKL